MKHFSDNVDQSIYGLLNSQHLYIQLFFVDKSVILGRLNRLSGTSLSTDKVTTISLDTIHVCDSI